MASVNGMQKPEEVKEATTSPKATRIARYDQYFDQRTFSYALRKTSKPSKKHNSKKPILVVRRIIDEKGRFVDTEIDIQSPALCEILMEINEGVEGLNLLLSSPVGDPHLFFFSHSGLKARMSTERSKEVPDEAIITDLQVALDYIEEDLTSTFDDLEKLSSGNSITFNLLWTIFAPNTLVYNYHQHTEQDRILKVLRFAIRMRRDYSKYALITCAVITNDGNSFGIAEEPIEIDEFSGARLVQDLPLYPLKDHSRCHEIKTMAIERGKRFALLDEPAYGEISGPAVREIRNAKDEPIMKKFNTYGRLMVDPSAFRTFQANCVFNLRVIMRLRREQLTDEEYMICTPIVLGFCFGVKEWAGYALDRMQNIKWSDESFESLVLGSKQKLLIHALVKQHDVRSSKFDDIIQGKGKGLIGLLAGPPGCGKTLTAEAVAESTQRPLYCISAGELGTEPRQVDKALIQILEIAQRWKAVLLLDEADVFLFQRDDRDVVRNALVSIFLRQLEYYQGILFLTTNMIAQCDSAFESRIHFTINYPPLDYSSRRQVWKTFIKRASPTEVTDADIDTLANEDMNGRQIKNTISTAQSIALSEEKELAAEHIRTVLEVSRDWHLARNTSTNLTTFTEQVESLI
ncbi:P-loop containing nucleoside triphosphate hydrolase protein [Crucibulum laeve]|uniref:P-loop containing nucleoside triphosphate hydrolase protein n=1 Tax=Crucibulum laeve TaxID=68775 RepID=A0A5C3LYS3_9AGAR|nr:P-loop containing nucleoside triphosphate hydrolase protein [Crucibulum laeve]